MICDLAEYYHIFNYRELSSSLVATLVFGLRDNSRVKMHFSKSNLSLDQILKAMMVDSLNFLAWTKTKDAKHGRYKEKSILKLLQGEYDEEKDDLQSFKTIEEFERYMKQFEKGEQ